MGTSIMQLFAVYFLFVTFALADEPSKTAKIDEILTVTRMDRAQQQVIKQVESMVPSFIADAGIPPSAQKVGQELAGKIADLVHQRLAWEQLKPAYVKLYAETFTEEEVSAILDFYRTPAGKALTEKTPDMMSKSNAIVQEKVTALIPEVNELTREYIEKYRKQVQDPQPKP